MGKKLTIFKDTQSQPTFLDPTTNSQGSMREEGGKKPERNKTEIRKTREQKEN